MAGGRRGIGGIRGGPPPRSGPRRRLDDAAVERVCAIIADWSKAPLTWEGLTEVVAQKERGGWTRQTLSGNEKVAAAFDKRKLELRTGRVKPPRDPAVVLLKRDIAARDAEIVRLRSVLMQYEERFLRMIRNAALHGLTQEQLERSPLAIDRKSI